MPRPSADEHLSAKRPEPPLAGDEKSVLVGFLEYHRQTLLLKCAGLTPEQLVTPAVPTSDLRLLGLIRHLADVEHGWFSEMFDGQPRTDNIWGPGLDIDLLIEDASEAAVTLSFARYAEEVAASRAITDAAELDQLAARRTEDGRPFSLRWILVHMVEEYAWHNGHADLIRQAIDGSVGE